MTQEEWNAYLAETRRNRHPCCQGDTPSSWCNDSWANHIEEVPVDMLLQYMEHDRSINNNLLGYMGGWDKFKEEIAKNGITESLILDYNPEYGVARLCEGNHRLAIAKELGLKCVPVRMYVAHSLKPGPDRVWDGRPVPGAKLVTNDYVGDILPSDVFDWDKSQCGCQQNAKK